MYRYGYLFPRSLECLWIRWRYVGSSKLNYIRMSLTKRTQEEANSFKHFSIYPIDKLHSVNRKLNISCLDIQWRIAKLGCQFVRHLLQCYICTDVCYSLCRYTDIGISFSVYESNVMLHYGCHFHSRIRNLMIINIFLYLYILLRVI